MIVTLEDDERRRVRMQGELEGRFPGLVYRFFDNVPDLIGWVEIEAPDPK